MRQYLLQSHQAPKTTLKILKILDIFHIYQGGKDIFEVKKARNKCLYIARELNYMVLNFFITYILVLIF